MTKPTDEFLWKTTGCGTGAGVQVKDPPTVLNPTPLGGDPVIDQRCTRRSFGMALAAGALAACKDKEFKMPDSPTVAFARQYAEQHLPPERRAWLIKTAHEVERDYTTAIVREHYRGRIYEWPANFMSYTGRQRLKRYAVAGSDRYEILKAGESMGQWKFFWPAFNGYTLENWVNPFDRQMIDYVDFSVQPPDYPALTTSEILKHLQTIGALEARPSVELHGLQGYRAGESRAGYHNDYLWVGECDNGQMFSMQSFNPQDRAAVASKPYPHCDVRMYDRASGEDVTYRYSIQLFEHWREIETRTRSIITSWRVS